MEADDLDVAPPPAPEGTINSDPNIDQGADIQKPVYTKPFQQLAEIMYRALRKPFDQLSPRDRHDIEVANAKDISDDRQADQFFTLIENILKRPSFNGVVESARIIEADGNNGGAMGDGQSMDAEVAVTDPQMGTTQTPESGSGQEPMFDMPYPDLARLLDSAIRMSFEELESSAQRKLQAIHPDDFKDDQQGVVFIKTLKSVVDEENGPEPEDQSVEGGGGFGPAAG